MIRIGTAGWSYRDWAGIVYPAPKPTGFDPLEYLARYFDTIEINSTFYRPAREKTAHSRAERVKGNDDFRFTTKLWRRFTHERKEAWTADEVDKARGALDVLRDEGRLGAVLLQFPWSFRNTEENREWLDDAVAAFDDFPLVIEVRHSSWNEPGFFRDLVDHGVGFVNIDQPLFDNSIEPSARATSAVGYIRVHGRNYHDWFRDKAGPDERYDYLYSPRELKPWAERAKEIDADPVTREIYVIANNHYKGKALANALMLESMVEGGKVTAPAPLLDEYGKELKRFARAG